MEHSLPQVTRVYQNHHLDSTRWNTYTPRDDDIIITTAYKSGTTWMQLIMKYLILPDSESESLGAFSRWIGSTWNPIEEVIATFEAQTHQRVIKSHLALDGLPYFPQVKYIVVGRDTRDVFMSFWNHYSNYVDEFYDEMNNSPNLVGEPLPRCPEDIHELWNMWITRGWFEWESEGYPFWGNLHHTKTYWEFKHLPNILFVHFNNLLSQPYDEIKRIAHYVGIKPTDAHLKFIVEATKFKNFKENSEKILGAEQAFKGGSKTFLNKGTNGRWKDVLSEEELQLYTEAVTRVLTPDCAHWLETGEMPSNSSK